MPCDSLARTAAEKLAREKAREELERKILTGEARLEKDYEGNITIEGWDDPAARFWCDGCVLAKIAAEGSWVAQQHLAQFGVQKGQMFQTAGHGHAHKVPK